MRTVPRKTSSVTRCFEGIPFPCPVHVISLAVEIYTVNLYTLNCLPFRGIFTYNDVQHDFLIRWCSRR